MFNLAAKYDPSLFMTLNTRECKRRMYRPNYKRYELWQTEYI